MMVLMLHIATSR